MRSHSKTRRGQQPAATAELPAVAGPSHYRQAIIALAVFAAVFSTLEVVAYTQKSATWDEPIHLTTGYAALSRGDYRVDATHPPFMRMWAALPLLAMPSVRLDTSVIDRTPVADWVSGSTAYDFSTRFLYVDNDADRLLAASRFMIVIWGVVLGVLMFCWMYEWMGFRPAALVLAFYTLSPNLMAHASVVTTDIGITCFIFGTVYFLWRTSRRASAFNLGGLTAFFALAIVTKFSALILGPIVALLLLVAWWQRTAITPRLAAGIIALLATASFGAVWAISGFRYAPSPSPSWVMHLEQTQLAQRTVPEVARVTGWIDAHHLLPNIYTEGFLMFMQSMQPPNLTFLAGAYSNDGWWYYFPVAFLIKTPLALIVLFSVGLVACVRRWPELQWRHLAFLAVPGAIYLIPAVTSQYQVGLRHILPIYPFVLMVAALGSREFLRRPAGRVLLGSMAVFWVASVASVYPHTLTFFNWAVGGPREGYRYLADSNLDWGQGLKLLKQWMDEQHVTDVNLAYFGTADPAYYGIDYTPLPAATPSFVLSSIARPWEKPKLPGYVAVGATVLSGVYLEPRWRLFYQNLRQENPVAVLGNSVYVYWLERWPESDSPDDQATPEQVDAQRLLAESLMSRQWFAHAITHYRLYLRSRPDDPKALTNLGLALVSTGNSQEAISALQRGLALAPDNGLGQLLLASTLFDARYPIDDVIRHARLAAAALPADASPLVLLGRALAVKGAWSEAAAMTERALEIAPNDEDAQRLREQLRSIAAQPGNTRHPTAG